MGIYATKSVKLDDDTHKAVSVDAEKRGIKIYRLVNDILRKALGIRK